MRDEAGDGAVDQVEDVREALAAAEVRIGDVQLVVGRRVELPE